MNGPERKIEIFKPFGEAFELMQKILFQPFDLAKWCVIGFAAFLAGGVNFNLGFRFPGGNWDFRSSSYTSTPRVEHLQGWLIALIAVAFLIVLAIVVVLSWVRARGVFIFTDCIVRNRAAIVEPWKEFRREGNSLFLFSWLVGLLFLAMAALSSLVFLFPIFFLGKDIHDVGVVLALIFFFAVIFFAAVAWCFASLFMVPIMYRRRCRAFTALQESAALVIAYPLPVILYCLFLIVLGIACVIAACAITCLTCCIAAIPYVGTVILLPILVLFRAFLLLFLRQFGPDYDVWVGIREAEAPAPAAPPSPEPPPLPA